MMRTITVTLVLLMYSLSLFSQEHEQPMEFTLSKAIEIAQQNSPSAVAARNNFCSRYWSYIRYKANYLPSLDFSSGPNFNHSISIITMPDGTSDFVGQNQLVTDGTFSLNQNVALTGGTFFVRSALERLDIFDNNLTTYKSSPVIIGYQQSLTGYNRLKWDRKIEPLRFEEAQKSYIQTMETVAAQATAQFFNLAMAQTNLQIAQINYANADTLYMFAQGRYKMGTITENEMLQLEINRLSEESNLLNSQIETEDCMQEFKSFLGIKDQATIMVKLENDVPSFVLDPDHTLELALQNNPNILAWKRLLLEGQSYVAQARTARGFNIDLFAQFGLTNSSREFDQVYKDPLNQQSVQLGIRIPILDWGRGKGNVEVARSNLNLTQTQVEQERATFEQNVTKTVKQFNIQKWKIDIAVKTDSTTERREEVSRRLYILGRSTILDMNSSIVEKNTAKRGYINALYSFWNLYFTIRRYTLYDFEKNAPITVDYNELIK